MKRTTIFTVVLFVMSVALCAQARADSVTIIRQGLLGAGTGAIATAVSGAKGEDVWKGALVGAGVNVIGGALLDVITTPSGQSQAAYVPASRQAVYVSKPAQAAYYAQPQRVIYVEQQQPSSIRKRRDQLRRAYKAGYRSGYDRGYREGYEDAMYYL